MIQRYRFTQRGSPNMKSLFSSRLVPSITGTRFQPSGDAKRVIRSPSGSTVPSWNTFGISIMPLPG